MTSETDQQFMARVDLDLDLNNTADLSRLFALARRGAGLELTRQKLVSYPDGSEWVEEQYARFVPYIPPSGEPE